MATRKKKSAGTTRKKQKRFNFQLGFTGLAGVTVVCFCLFLWMFLLGIWAGQTILFPAVNDNLVQSNINQSGTISAPKDITVIHPDGRKKEVSGR